MVARIQLRRDVATDWQNTNPVLSAGELGYESDTDKLKIGDGSTTWNQLGYIVYTLSFSDILNKPTTINGYGITDAFDGRFDSLYPTPTTIAGYGITDAFDGAFSSLTGVPTTIAGYGITDAFDGAFSSLSGKPTTIAGYGITDAFDGAFSSLTGTPTTIAGYGITDAFNGTFSALTGKPTTIAGYGITDAFDAAFSSLTGTPTTIAGYGITDAFDGAFSSLTATPTTLSGYGITDAAPLNSPSLTGAPTAPTAPLGTNSTQIATTAFVSSKLQQSVGTANKVYFQDTAPTFNAFNEIWIDTDAGGLYKSVASTTIVPLDSSMVSSSSSNITIPAAGATDTRLVLDAGLPSGSVDIDPPLFLESFSSTGVNDPTIGTLTYFDDTTAAVDSNSFSRSSGNAFDKKVKSFTYTSEGTTNSNTSHITLTISGVPEWQVQESDLQAKIDALVDSAPGALDTLNELAAAIGDDANFSTTITNSIATKAPLSSPALTGSPTAPTPGTGTNNTRIATTAFVQNSIANFSTLGSLSVTSNTASGGGALSYNSGTGVFSYTPPDLSSFLTSLSFSGLANTPTTLAGYGITDAATSASPTLTGTPAAPTAALSTNTTQIATTEFVQNALNNATASVTVSDAAPSSPGNGDLWYDSTNLQMFIYYDDGDSDQWVQTNPSGAVLGLSDTIFSTNNHTSGELELLTGTERWYAPYNIVITEVVTNLGTAADDVVTAVVKKNGSTFITINLAAGDTSATLTGQTLSVNSNSYLTVDITATGTTNKGEDLYLQFKYRRA